MKGVKWRLGMTIKDVEKNIIRASMTHFDNNKTKVAASLDISVRTVENKLKLYKQQEDNAANRT